MPLGAGGPVQALPLVWGQNRSGHEERDACPQKANVLVERADEDE